MTEIIGWIFYVITVWFFLASFLNLLDILKGNIPFKVEVPVMLLTTGVSLIFFLVTEVSKLHMIWILPVITAISMILRKIFKKDLASEIPMSKIAEMQVAVKHYTQSIKLHPEDITSYYNRGLAYEGTGKYQQAIDDYSTFLDAQPDDAQAYKNRGRSYLMLSNYQQAIKDFGKVIELVSDDAEAYFFRGASSEKSGDPKQALTDYRVAASLGHTAAIEILRSQKTSRLIHSRKNKNRENG